MSVTTSVKSRLYESVFPFHSSRSTLVNTNQSHQLRSCTCITHGKATPRLTVHPWPTSFHFRREESWWEHIFGHFTPAIIYRNAFNFDFPSHVREADLSVTAYRSSMVSGHGVCSIRNLCLSSEHVQPKNKYDRKKQQVICENREPIVFFQVRVPILRAQSIKQPKSGRKIGSSHYFDNDWYVARPCRGDIRPCGECLRCRKIRGIAVGAKISFLTTDFEATRGSLQDLTIAHCARSPMYLTCQTPNRSSMFPPSTWTRLFGAGLFSVSKACLHVWTGHGHVVGQWEPVWALPVLLFGRG